MIASAAELASRVQADVDTATANLLLEIAEDVIVQETGVLSPWPARVKGVQLDMVTRAYVNPAGVKHELFETYTRTGIPEGGIYLTPAERVILRQASGKVTGLVSVRLITPAENTTTDLAVFTGDWP